MWNSQFMVLGILGFITDHTAKNRKSPTTFRESLNTKFWKSASNSSGADMLILLYPRKTASDAYCTEYWIGPRPVWTSARSPVAIPTEGGMGKRQRRACSWLWDKNLKLIHINVTALNLWEVCHSAAVSNWLPVRAFIIRTILPQCTVWDWRFYPAAFHDGILFYI